MPFATSRAKVRFTGEGLTLVGNPDLIELSDRGVLHVKGYNNNNYLAATNMNASTVLQKPFEFRIKFKILDPEYQVASIVSTNSPNYSVFQIVWDKRNNANYFWYLGFVSSGSSKTNVSVTCPVDPKIVDSGQWLYLSLKFTGTEYTWTIEDESHRPVATNTVQSSTVVRSDKYVIVFGNEPDGMTSICADNYMIDMTKTYIKDGQGKLISSWNLSQSTQN